MILHGKGVIRLTYEVVVRKLTPLPEKSYLEREDIFMQRVEDLDLPGLARFVNDSSAKEVKK
jgi:hypothetical protein